MRIKVIVIELPVPPALKRWAIRIGVAAGVLGGASVAALASVPKTWSGGETLKSADLNDNFSNLDARLTKLEDAGSPTTIQVEQLTPNDSDPSSVNCFMTLQNGAYCSGQACPYIPFWCSIAAQNKCNGLGLRAGFFVGTTGTGINTEPIVCIN
ncbi:MAG: hypothetical protein FWD17_08515 [Polyangiaceae bacterium]|nr:hypothetical protein [Polyangiaceae bacterium]